jgi:hypothetical protein
MAKSKKKDEDLFKRLRSLGIRKKTASDVARSMRNSNRPAPKAARRAIADLTGAVAEMKDRIDQGPQKRKAAAKKAARTRARKAKKRSESAKKAAQTRAGAKA